MSSKRRNDWSGQRSCWYSAHHGPPAPPCVGPNNNRVPSETPCPPLQALRPPAPLYKPTRRESTVLTAPPLRLLMSCNTIQWHQPELGWTRKCLNCALGIISGRRQWTLWTWLLSDLSFCCSGCVMIHHQSPLDVGNKLYTSATVLSMLISSNVGLKHLL